MTRSQWLITAHRIRLQNVMWYRNALRGHWSMTGSGVGAAVIFTAHA